MKLLKKLLKNIVYKKYYQNILTGESILNRESLVTNPGAIKYSDKQILTLKNKEYQIIGMDKQPEWISNFEKEYDYQGCYYTILKNTSLIGKHATAIHRNKIVLDTILNSLGYLYFRGDRRLLLLHKFIKPKIKIEYALSLVNPLNNSYFHWVAEAMPLLEAWFNFIKKNPNLPKPKIIINSPAHSFIYEYLELLNIGKESIIEWKPNKAIVKNLLVPTVRYYRIKEDNPFWSMHFYPKKNFSFISEKLTVKRDYLHPKKIYISRNDAGRKVINEDALINFLTTKGYKAVTLSQLSVAEQINLFKNISHAIIPHGAALINTIFSKNLKIIELFPNSRNNYFAHYYYQISNYFNHKHTLLVCDSNKQEEITVDINLLNDLIQ